VPEPLLRDVARQVALSLAALHAAGIIHRDLKPGNLIITPDQQVRVMDLGIAVDLGDEARLTQAGMFVGTLLYASPEQFGRGSLGPASDLYSLGALLYEACTGTQPFDAPDVRGVLRLHLEHVPRRAGQIDPGISPFFEELLADLLEKEPARRPASAAILANTLLEGESSPWWRERERALREASPRGEIRRPRQASESPLIGRVAELAILRDCIDAARAGSGRVVVVEGEAGVGKSRLLDALADAVVAAPADGVMLLRSASAPGDMSLGVTALGAALLGALGLPELRRQVNECLASRPRLASGFLAHVLAEPPPPGEAPLSLESLAAAVCALARALASRGALAWLVEDLHFASAESRALVLALARMAPSHPIALIVTARPRAVPESDELARLPRAERVTLGRLSAAESVRLVASALGSDTVADRIGGKIARKSDGNPFFILEMLREAKERGLLRRGDDGGWHASTDTAALDVPSSVRDFLHGRLRDLRDEDRALLDVASVIGFHFDPDLVARVLERKRLDVLQALASLARRSGVVQATGAGFQFDHHQLQEVIYQNIAPLLRAEYHALVADAWRDRAGLSAARPDEFTPEAVILLAEHLLKGGRGLEGARLAPRAIILLVGHAEFDAAVLLGELALPSLGASDDALRCDIQTALAGCFNLLRRQQREREFADDALAAATRLGDRTREALARRALGLHYMTVPDYPRALDALRRAVALAEDSRDLAAEVRALGPLGAVHFRMGDYRAARAVNERYAERARALGDDVGILSALGQLGTLMSRLGEDDAALEMFERSAEIARQIGRRRLESLGVARAGFWYLARARYVEARRCLEQAAAISRELGLATADSDESIGLAYVACGEGHLVEARERATHSLALTIEAGVPTGQVPPLDELAFLDLLEGRIGDAEAHHARSVEVAGDVEGPLVAGLADLLRGQIDDARGRDARAVEAYDRAIQAGVEIGDRSLVNDASLERIRHFIERGDVESARGAFAEALSGSVEPRWLVALMGAAVGEASVADLPVPEQASWIHRVLGHLCLARATGEREPLRTARALIDSACAHFAAPDWERFWQYSPLGRFYCAADKCL
jgi:tetratricopeptide (TPR) repeat protein